VCGGVVVDVRVSECTSASECFRVYVCEIVYSVDM